MSLPIKEGSFYKIKESYNLCGHAFAPGTSVKINRIRLNGDIDAEGLDMYEPERLIEQIISLNDLAL